MKWLKERKEQQPQKLFLNDWTFKEVYDKVLELAEKLKTIVEHENRVAIYAETSPETAIFIMALLLLKKEILLLNHHLTQKEIEIQTKQLDIQKIFSSDDAYISFKSIDTVERQSLEVSWEDDPERIAVIMNTSATTGHFKAVPIKWRQIEAHVRASAKALSVKEEDDWLLILPLFHVSGLCVLFRSLFNGTHITILGKYDEEKLLKYLELSSVNMISMVPTMLKKIIGKLSKHKLRVILLGGEFIPEALIKECLIKKLPIYKTYGMTETVSQSTTFCILDYPEKIDSVGRPLQGVDVVIRNQDPNGIGEIWLKSPMLMDGYLGKDLVRQYFNTEDIGYVDRDGFLYILNRRKDIIISGGENIYPKEIEDVLYGMPEVKECVVVGKEDEKWGQIPILYLVSSLKEEKVLQYLAQNLARYKMPKKIKYMKELPKNSSGKIMRSKL